LVEVIRCDFVDAVALIVGGIVDEDVDGGVVCEDGVDGGFRRRNVREIAVDVFGGRAALDGERVHEGVCGFVIDVEESDAGALASEVCDDGFADAGGAAGDEDDTVSKAG